MQFKHRPFKIKAFTAIATALALAVGLMASQAAAVTKLDMTNEYSATMSLGKTDIFFADKVKELSGGSLVITLHLGGSLGFKSKDNLDAVGDGAVPIADTLGGVLAGSDPVFLLSSLPFMAFNSKEARELYLAAKPAYEAFFKKHGQILLYASPWSPSGLWAKKVVDSADALKGLKMRTYDASGTRTLIAAGASPIQLSWADVVPQLATKGIVGVLTSAEGGVTSKFWEHLSHFTEINYAMPLNFAHMNAEAFEGLNAEQKKAIRDAAGATDVRNWKLFDTIVEESYVKMRKNNVTITKKVPTAFRVHLSEAASVVLADWKKKTGAAGAEILQAYGKKVGRQF